ncbi:MAG: hypothetical protein AAF585_06205 [Verrucomicrobiota bacterium]
MVDFRVRPEKADFLSMENGAWWGPMNLSWAQFEDRDLVIGGQAISNADPDAVRTAGSIAMERHKASNWLLGYSAIYSETDTST